MTSDRISENRIPGINTFGVPENVSQELWLKQYFKKQEGWLKMLSGSMHPLIPVSARIFLKPIPLSQISLGDVIVFMQKTKIVSHWVIRIIREEQNFRFIQQGNNYSSPGIIDGKDILGKVFVVEHNGRSVKLDTFGKRLYSFRKVIIMRFKYTLYSLLNVLCI